MKVGCYFMHLPLKTQHYTRNINIERTRPTYFILIEYYPTRFELLKGNE